MCVCGLHSIYINFYIILYMSVTIWAQAYPCTCAVTAAAAAAKANHGDILCDPVTQGLGHCG